MVRALRAVIGKQWRIQRRVVNRALLGPNQSERSKFFVDQSESSIYPTWLMWRHNAHIWAWKFTWPHRVKNTHTQAFDPHCSHSFIDACAVWPKTFTMRSHVNGVVGSCADRPNSPQVPRIRVSLFSRRPTTHAQTMKRSPRPLASLKAHEKTHCIEVNIHLFFNEHTA